MRQFNSRRPIHTPARNSTALHPKRENKVVLNYWSPGYKDKQGKFIPTSTGKAALVHLKNQYGAQEYLKFKKDAHPGHVSLMTSNQYLSVGTDDAINEVTFSSEHNLALSDSLREDTLAFGRFPELRLNLYTLDVSKVDSAIRQIIESQEIYSLLGKRFGFAIGESCATSNYLCLVAGGIENLLSIQQQILSQNFILTPTSLKRYVHSARNEEKKSVKEVLLFYKSFEEESASLKVKYEKEIEEIAKKLQSNIPTQRP